MLTTPVPIEQRFIHRSRAFLSADYLPKVETAVRGLSDEDV